MLQFSPPLKIFALENCLKFFKKQTSLLTPQIRIKEVSHIKKNQAINMSANNKNKIHKTNQTCYKSYSKIFK